ncbi:MAG: Gfo/Idh/MocA family oxidoreductase [Candidatus Heimdallarchaeota archaeon]|nr:MAG: Gfo/Idh/MocA family oxidoreductase [Candidatus Heimdallarchaeota archaeon]
MPDDPIKIAVVGTGKMGYYHARLLSRLGYLDSIVDSNPKVAEAVGKQFEKPWFSSIEKMVENQNPNGVIIAVPTETHPTVASEVITCMPEIKALLIEKPIAPSVQQAIDLREKLSKFDTKVVVGHIEVFNPVVTRIAEILGKENLIGKPRSVLFQRRGAVAETRIESIGDVYEDIGVHDFDIALRLFIKGKVRLYSTAVKLNGLANSSILVISSEAKEFNVTFLTSREYAGKLRTIDIEGTHATLCANLLTQILEMRSLEIARGDKDVSAISIPFSNGEQIKVYGEPLLHEIWNFVDCIRGKANPLVSIEDGINVLKIVEAARKSIEKGDVIHLQI